MKKFIVIIFTFLLLFNVSSCAFIGYQQEIAPQNIYKDYVSNKETDDQNLNFESNICIGSNSILTVISCTNLRLNGEYTSVINIYSGVIINSEGYLLTTVQAALLDVFDGDETIRKSTNEVYAILPDIYQDETQYKLKLIDYDSEAGLALYCFYDHFYYYTDSEKSSAVEGFQFYSTFSGNKVSIGDACAAVGNSLGNILNGEIENRNSISYIQTTITSGYISDDSADPEIFETYEESDGSQYFIISAPTNIDMIGGGVFDKSGYLIGIIASKIVSSQERNASQYLSRVSLAYSSKHVMNFIDRTSTKISKVIHYSYAISGGEGG